jgi:hypothetical protein
LDINLENTEHLSEVKKLAKQFNITEQEFLEQSGMNLFLNLLEHGFPKEQIIFVTAYADINISRVDELKEAYRLGNDEIFNETIETIQNELGKEEVIKCFEFIGKEDIDGLCQYLNDYFDNLKDKNNKNTYNSFCEAYRRCRIEPPKAINKDIVKQHLNNWLEHHEKNNYLVLRRGIIEGCRFLKDHIVKNDRNIQFRDFIRQEYYQPVIEIPRTDIENYLDSVSHFLAIKQPNNLSATNTQYRLFLRTLVHEWEENINPNMKYKDNDIHTFAWLSKMTRNWTSHATLLEPLDDLTIAFLFLVNMRAMFKLPKKINPYEEILLGCMSTSPEINSELENHIKNSENDIDEILASLKMSKYKQDKNGKEIKDKNGKEILKDFGDKVNDIYRRNTGQHSAENHDYKGFLLQYFWVNQKSYLSNLTASSDDFLPTLARHIYSRSFSEK